LVGGPRLDAGPDDVLEVLVPVRALREARVVEPLRVPDDLAELLDVVLADGLYDEPAVLRAEAREDARGARTRVGAADAQRIEVRYHVGHRDHHVEHRDVDARADAGRVAPTQR